MRTMTKVEWMKEASRRFGMEAGGWRFVCPSCGHVASVKDWEDAKAPEGAIAFSCVGRWRGADGKNTFKRKNGEPCNYAGGGLFKLNPVTVVDNGKEHHVFDFAAA